MKRRLLSRIALILALAMLLPTILVAVADAPEELEIEIDGIGLATDGTGEDLTPDSEEVTIEDGNLILDDTIGDDLLSGDLLDIGVSDASLLDATDAAGLGLQSDDAGMSESAEETIGSVTTSGGMDNDALFEAWMNHVLPGRTSLRRNASARSGRASLSGLNRKLYDALVPMIREVAEGKRTSTMLKVDDVAAGLSDSWWTAEQLGVSLDDKDLGMTLLAKEGFDQRRIMQALLADCPYDLYWFDKVTGGMGWSYVIMKQGGKARLSSMTAMIAVAVDYSRTGVSGTFEVNDLPQRVSTAVANINSVIADNMGRDDLARLRAYANAICGRVAYNRDAAGNPNTPYGDPWQLVYIFDGDDSTNVVCEGYSKGFKYLCDLSDFDGEVYVELMSGTIPGNHMWNAVRMPDGRCYLVDLTNSDGGDACNEKYFLKGCTDQTASGFTCGSLSYTYNDQTRALFSSDWLTMSGTDYGKGYAVTTSATNGTLSASTQTANAGEPVTLTLTPEKGFAATAPTVRSGNRSIVVVKVGSGQWRFTMPYGDVTASADCEPNYKADGWSGAYDGENHGISVSTAVDYTVTYGTASGAYSLAQSPVWKDVGTYTAYYCVRSADAVVAEGKATVTITPKTVGLNWTNTSLTYNGATQAPLATATGLVAGDACSVAVAGGQRKAGTYTATATGLSNGNYALPGSTTRAFSIAPKPVTLTWDDTELTYNGATQQPTASAEDLVGDDECSVAVAGGQRNAGAYTATATGLSNANYALTGSTTRAFSIAPKPVTLTWSDTELTYNGATQQPAASADGLVGDDECSVAVAGGQRNVGTYTATATGLSNGNYTILGDVARTFTIAPRVAQLVWEVDLTYNGAAQGPSVTLDNLVSGDECRVVVAGEGRDAGTYTATVTALSNGNYALPENLTRTFTIAPKTVGLKWSKTSVVYNGKAQKPKLTLTGVEPGDVCKVTVKGYRKNAGNFTAKATKLSNANYALPAVRTKVCTIRKRTVKLKWSNTRLKYNGKNQKPTATATGLIKGDKCKVTVSGAKKKKGTYTAKATKLSNKNYQLPAKATVKFRIY